MIHAPDRCLHCAYSLRGLPAAHACPECGQSYDQHTRLWRPQPRPLRLIGDLLGPTLGAAGPLPLAWMLARFYGPWHPFTLAMLTISALFAFAALLRYRGGGLPRYLAVSPAGLLFCHEGSRKLIPWERIVDVRHTWHGTILRYRLAAGSWRFALSASPRVFDHRREAEEFCAAVAQARTRYR